MCEWQGVRGETNGEVKLAETDVTRHDQTTRGQRQQEARQSGAGE